MTDAESEAAMALLAKDLRRVAEHLGPGYGLDYVQTAMCLGLGATVMLFRIAAAHGEKDKALGAVEIMNETALRAVADMIAGRETTHRTKQ